MHGLDSPFIVPVVAMLIPIVAIVGGVVSQVSARRVKADQRMALLARGVAPAEVEAILRGLDATEHGAAMYDPARRVRNSRTAAIVLIAVGLGIVAFFGLLEVILNVRPVLAGAAAGLIPLAIGVGFLVDYRLQRRDLEEAGLSMSRVGAQGL